MLAITLEHGRKITQNFLGEHKVIPLEKQFPGMFFYVFRMAVAIVFLCENAVEAIQISSISMILSLSCISTVF